MIMLSRILDFECYLPKQKKIITKNRSCFLINQIMRVRQSVYSARLKIDEGEITSYLDPWIETLSGRALEILFGAENDFVDPWREPGPCC
jgi:hypothetical protein